MRTGASSPRETRQEVLSSALFSLAAASKKNIPRTLVGSRRTREFALTVSSQQQIDPAEAQHHEVEIESDRYENHYVLPVERRRTINGGDRRGAALVFAYFTIESVDEQPGIRRTL